MYQICQIRDMADLDAMPVLKTTYYPWTDSSFRPLCYGRLALVESRGLLVDLQAFERDPDLSDGQNVLNNSCAVLTMDFQNGQPPLTLAFNADGRYRAFLGEAPLDLPLETETYGGGDEQGWYWGVRALLDEPLLENRLSVPPLREGHIIKGNIYKFLRGGSGAHMGAVAPMTEESIFSPANLAPFEILPA